MLRNGDSEESQNIPVKLVSDTENTREGQLKNNRENILNQVPVLAQKIYFKNSQKFIN